LVRRECNRVNVPPDDRAFSIMIEGGEIFPSTRGSGS